MRVLIDRTALNVIACIQCGEHDGGSPARLCNHNQKDITDNAVADECPHPSGRRYPARGLGDTVAKIIKVVTGGLVKQKGCGGCAARQAALNQAVPYKRS